jgi:hypothetical protein
MNFTTDTKHDLFCQSFCGVLMQFAAVSMQTEVPRIPILTKTDRAEAL